MNKAGTGPPGSVAELQVGLDSSQAQAAPSKREQAGQAGRSERDPAQQPQDTARLQQSLAEESRTRQALLYILEDIEEKQVRIEQAQREWIHSVDALRDPLLVHDADYRVLRCNRAYAERAGMAFHDMIGRRYWECFPRRDGPLSGDIAAGGIPGPGAAADARGQEFSLDTGETFISRAFAIPGHSGSKARALRIFEDITERKRMQDALARSERHYKKLIEGGSDVFFLIDRAGKLIYRSESGKRLTGWDDADVLGQDITGPRYLAPDSLAVARNAIAEIIRHPEKVTRVELRLRCKDGSHVDVEALGKNLLADPDLRGIVVTAHDITERKKSEQALKLFRTLIDQSNDAIEVVDPVTLAFLDINDRACLDLGYSREQLLSMSAFDIDPQLGPSAAAEIDAQVRRSGFAIIDSVHRRKDGSTFPVEVSIRRITLDRTYQIASIRDVTERKRTETELKRLNWALRALGQSNSALVHAGTETELFQSCCDAIAGSEGYPLAWIGLARDDAAHSVDIVAAAGEARKYVETFVVSWADDPLGRGPTGTAIRSAMTQVTNDLTGSGAYLPWLQDARAFGLASFVVLPIRANDVVTGALAVYSREPDAFGQAEVELFEELAADIGYGIASRRTRVAYEASLVERERSTHALRAAFESLIAVLAATVERRDPYTAGHQRRVAELAAAIGRTLGLDPARIEGLRFAATIHDIGKIYVPAEILARPGKLPATEFEMIKAHAQVGFEIVKDVEFPWQVADMIRQHHERIDGSGYPQGLKGDQLLLESRILAVADVVEAMSSHRPYRPGLGLDAALAQIKKEAGTTLDAQVVEACERVFREQGFSFPKA